MRNVTFITECPENYSEIANELYQNENAKINFTVKDNIELVNNCIYIYEINSIDDLNLINKNYPFLIISNITDTNANTAIKCYKHGALDCLLNPKNYSNLYIKIKRYLVDFDNIIDHNKQTPEVVTLGFYDVIRKDLKGANRGKYDYSIIGLFVENKVEEKVKDYININSRETDTAMTYNENVVIISMPFCDKNGTLIVIERMKASLKEKFKIATDIYGATLNVNGDSKEELIDYILNNLSKNKKALDEAVISI